MHWRHHHPHGRRLFWRVYLHGVMLLLVVAASIAGLGWAMGRGSGGTWAEAMAVRGALEEGGPPLLENRAKLDELVHRAGERTGSNITLYRRDGSLLASNVDPPLPPLTGREVNALGDAPFSREARRWQLVMPVRHEGQLMAYAVAEWRGPGARELAKGLTYLGGILFALALASFPLVRTLVSPLERLTRAARALGAGDLSVRSGIRRGGEVGELALAFDEMAERLQRQVKNERELLANVSHELRTPLSRIRVALELAAEGDSQRAQKYLKEIGADLAELETLLEDVLTTARLDSSDANGGAFPLHRSKVSAQELVESSARRFQERWPERTLRVELADGLPPVDVDPMLMRRVVDNLLDNARKYSEDGKPVTLSARVEDSALRIDVSDEGIGMTEEDLKQVFTPFFRSDRSRQRGTGGVGLGLALARRIVEAHGGFLTASSEPGKGSTFRVELPLSPGSAAAPA